MKQSVIILLSITLVLSQSFNFNEQISKDLAAFSLTAYCKPELIQSWTCGAPCEKNPQGMVDVRNMYSSSKNAHAFIGYSKGHDAIVVSFKGTSFTSISNWVSNLEVEKVKYSYCQENCSVHKGFLNHFNELKQQLIDNFNSLRQKYPKSKIFVTGHSLGAAVSFHAVPVLYQLNGRKPIDVLYTFGTPRVGDEDYSNWFNSQKLVLQQARITNGADPVPRVPPSFSPFSFKHTDYEVYYKSFIFNGSQSKQCIYAEDDACSKGVLLPVSAPDHLSYYGWDWVKLAYKC